MFGEAFEGEIEAGRLDYKRSLETTKPKSWLKTVSAFANTQGGCIIFGVTDDTHEPVGLDDVQKTASKVAELIADHIEPAVQYEFNVLHGKGGRPCLELEIYRGLSTPYYYKHEQSRTAFVRRGDRSEASTFIELNNLVLRGKNLTFDELPSTYMTNDLSFTLFGATYKQITRNTLQGKRDLVSMKLMAEDGRITNAGALLSDQGGLRQSRIVCTHWNGLQKGAAHEDASDDMEYAETSLIMLLRNAEMFIQNNSRHAWRVVGMQREESHDYPKKAIREALVNAIIHRDYQVIGSEIHVDMFDDRVEISSPGGMISGHRIQDCNPMNVPSRRRNEVLADVFARLHYMDCRGSGIARMLEPYKGYEKQPTFYSDEYMFLVTFPNCNYGVDGLVDMESLAVSVKERNTSSVEIDTSTAKPHTSTMKTDTSTVRPHTSTVKPHTSKEEMPLSRNVYQAIENYLMQHPRAFQSRNRELLLTMARQMQGSFQRKDICRKYGVSPSQAAKLLQKCLDIGWVKRERYGVYRFASAVKDGE